MFSHWLKYSQNDKVFSVEAVTAVHCVAISQKQEEMALHTVIQQGARRLLSHVFLSTYTATLFFNFL